MFTSCCEPCEPPEVPSEECCIFSKEMVEIRDCFRMLWTQHVYWTRAVVLAIIFDTPDQAAATERLLRNATDFGRQFRHFFGKRAGNEFERLMKDHITIAAEVTKLGKAGDKQALDEAEKRWYANADEIAGFMHHINHYWSLRHMRAMWRKHLDLLNEEITATLAKNYEQSIYVFYQVEDQALMMADDFAEGIFCYCNITCRT